MRPLLMIEINEISKQVIDLYLSKPGFENIKKVFREGTYIETKAVDAGELSPWITWPSFYRGISSEEHGIFHLGQDPKTFKGKSLWEEVRLNGGTLGIFGTLQSWPPQDPGQGGFYVPDTFATDAQCIPSYLSPLQEFNLNEVKQNGRVIKGGFLSQLKKAGIVVQFIAAGVRISTLFSLFAQVVGELVNPELRRRRTTFQTILFWDVFKNIYNPENPPTFSTFFTNHVASLQHRYWHEIFPKDFGKTKENLSHLDHAMKVLDSICEKVLEYRSTNPQLTIGFANSMSQAAIHRDYHEGVELAVKNLNQLLCSLGLNSSEFECLLAMTPQVAAKIPDTQKRASIVSALNSSETKTGTKLFSVSEQGETISITIKTPPKAQWTDEKILVNQKEISFDSFGIEVLQVEAGSGYHIPEGFLLVLTNQKKHWPKKIKATEAKALLAELMGFVTRKIA